MPGQKKRNAGRNAGTRNAGTDGTFPNFKNSVVAIPSMRSAPVTAWIDLHLPHSHPAARRLVGFSAPTIGFPFWNCSKISQLTSQTPTSATRYPKHGSVQQRRLQRAPFLLLGLSQPARCFSAEDPRLPPPGPEIRQARHSSALTGYRPVALPQRRTKNEERRTKNEERRTKNEERRPLRPATCD